LNFLVDTSAIVAFFVRSEVHHQSAKQFFQRHKQTRWIVLSTIFDETVTWHRAKISSLASIQVGKALRDEHHYIHLSNEEDEAVWQAFCKYQDKGWSYTDCSLLVMSQKLEVPNVILFDDHIRQMAGLGIICLP
jgi:uncharacterized protein